ncbi:MAG: hypothetical protein P4M07_10685 [Xanthobacteraceae bacterium]|jgi:DNA repair ATPase RecN|nr:hypothetical protein [Xanthobacteraceae bacterium]
MAVVTNELIYETLKQMQERHSRSDHKLDELKTELQAMRGHIVAVQQDIGNIYQTLIRHEARLERIERRLELNETVTP